MYKESWETSIREMLSCKKNFTDVMQSMKSAKFCPMKNSLYMVVSMYNNNIIPFHTINRITSSPTHYGHRDSTAMFTYYVDIMLSDSYMIK